MLGSPKCTVGRTRGPGRPGRACRQDDGALGVGSCTVRGPKLRPDSHIRRCSRKPAGTSRPVCAPPTNVDPGQIAPASFLSREDEIVHRKTFLLDTCESGGCALRIGLREFGGPKVGLPDRDLGHRRLCPRSDLLAGSTGGRCGDQQGWHMNGESTVVHHGGGRERHPNEQGSDSGKKRMSEQTPPTPPPCALRLF
eukprot:COSAG06_NODE_1488_length_9290_cov_4.140899_1_plen_196_part_00